MNKLRKGFTMIELLIVIAVLGVLAVAVLSAINPIEQINRGRDTGSRSDAEQLLSAIDRYYTAQNYYPWMANADSQNKKIDPMVEINSVTQTIGSDNQVILNRLSSGGSQEIKLSFITRITGTSARKLNIYYSGTDGNSVYVCFSPQSGSFREEAYNRCLNRPTDYPTAACSSCNASSDVGCYICLP